MLKKSSKLPLLSYIFVSFHGKADCFSCYKTREGADGNTSVAEVQCDSNVTRCERQTEKSYTGHGEICQNMFKKSK